jgi:hypothetical protein
MLNLSFFYFSSQKFLFDFKLCMNKNQCILRRLIFFIVFLMNCFVNYESGNQGVRETVGTPNTFSWTWLPRAKVVEWGGGGSSPFPFLRAPSSSSPLFFLSSPFFFPLLFNEAHAGRGARAHPAPRLPSSLHAWSGQQ